ncbi:3-oxoacyl-ACP reductase FabG [Dactylosporangium darangshiense]|uniref:3-oxoacyl-ACP reductase FabG n=2 Tax=Dactylosporangium darangshiense TaxID=579108 RepID=A0ABP8DG61_9ACTN
MMRFEGRTAVVTGAAQGIGAATAALLREQGAEVVRLDRQAGDGVVQCDVTDKEQVDEVFAGIGRIDILVNNAGITRDNLLFKMPYDEWQAVLNTNLTSMFLCCQAAQKVMVPARYGRIVNLSSRSALGNRGQVNYAAAKAGVQGLTATLAIELGPYDITVNAVAPGYIATPMTAATAERVGSSAEEHQAMAAERTPLRRVGRPEEVAAVIAFLASDEASYVSGQTLYVNGGAR